MEPLAIEPPIFFWSQPEYKFLSNFYPSLLTIDGKTWRTVEHRFQAMKTSSLEQQEEIRNAGSPKEAKKLGRKVELIPDWESQKFQVMEEALQNKFSMEPFRSLLLQTGNSDIYEDSPYDRIWGTGTLGGVGPGFNHLGTLLMEIRGQIKLQNHKSSLNTSVIPEGTYCYNLDRKCPYHQYVEISEIKHSQNNGYCHYLGIGDWDLRGGLLWDEVKECEIRK